MKRLKVCCVPLKEGVMVIAVFQIMASFTVVMVGTGIFFLGEGFINPPKTKYSDVNYEDEDEAAARAPEFSSVQVGPALIFLGLLSLLLDCMLLKGAKQRCEPLCTAWLVGSAFFWLLGLGQLLLLQIHLPYISDPYNEVLGLILQLYFMLVVWEFRRETLGRGAAAAAAAEDRCIPLQNIV